MPAPSDVGGSTTGSSGGGGSGGGGPASAEKRRGAIAEAGAEAKGTGIRRTAAARERRRRAAREEAIVVGAGRCPAAPRFGNRTSESVRREGWGGRTVVIDLVRSPMPDEEERRQPAAPGAFRGASSQATYRAARATRGSLSSAVRLQPCTAQASSEFLF